MRKELNPNRIRTWNKDTIGTCVVGGKFMTTILAVRVGVITFVVSEIDAHPPFCSTQGSFPLHTFSPTRRRLAAFCPCFYPVLTEFWLSALSNCHKQIIES